MLPTTRGASIALMCFTALSVSYRAKGRVTVSKRVSSYLIAKILGPFCSPIDEEYEKLMRVNINDDQQLIDLLQEYIVPHVREYDEESQEIIKDSLSYFIKSESLNLERVFDAFHIPFDSPEDISSFLNTLWSVLFDDEPIRENSVSDYIIDDSEGFVNSLYRKSYR
jgi:hypothetical protein